MADLIKRALARKRVQRGRIVNEEPDEKLVYVEVCIGHDRGACGVANCTFSSTTSMEQ